MKISEEELQRYIFGDLSVVGIKGEYVHFQYFDICPYGKADIVAVKRMKKYLTVYVIELKIEQFKSAHVSQLLRYCRGIDYALSKGEPTYKLPIKKVRPILVTPKISHSNNSDDVFMLTYIDNKIIKHYEYELSLEFGIKIKKAYNDWFKCSQYSLNAIKNLQNIGVKLEIDPVDSDVDDELDEIQEIEEIQEVEEQEEESI